jgi:HSP20 family protein
MSITRWDPFREMVTLREAMANLLEDSVVAPRGAQAGVAGNLAVDIKETPDNFVVTAALPGVKPEDVNISVLGETLRIQAETKEEHEEAKGNGNANSRWLVRERRYGMVQRVLSLPSQVKADEAQATFEHGVLTLTLPKAEAAKPRAIKINTQPAIESTASSTTAEQTQTANQTGA